MRSGGPNEEKLSIFDLLTKSEPKLSKAREVAVKTIAKTLLIKLQGKKPVPAWRLKENTKAELRETIRVELD